MSGLPGSNKLVTVPAREDWAMTSPLMPAAEEIRNLIVSGRINRWQPKTEVFLHSAARIEHVTQLIEPALSSGKTVICDRFFDSTFAYQGFGYGIDLFQFI